MRVLYLDIDTLRPDHLGCYGYHRNTSPNIDRIAAEGVRFENYYTPDAPCLPSRASLMSGMFGIHHGAINHGGTNADRRTEGAQRGFMDRLLRHSLPGFMSETLGMHTCYIGGFGRRHSLWSFYAGFREIHDTGKGGMESAEDVSPKVLDWIGRNAQQEDWFLHVNYWDPHTPYRAPEEFGNPFANDPLPDFYTQELIDEHRKLAGPHTIQDIMMYDNVVPSRWPRHVGEVKDMDDMRKLVDGYDCGIRYMDDHLGKIFQALEELGVMDDVAIVISADHGENMGELGIYAEHATADQITCRIPMIVRWPGKSKAGHVDSGLHYNLDFCPTIAELAGKRPEPEWEGRSFAKALAGEPGTGHEALVLSQCCHGVQRSVRWGDWIYIRTFHDGFHAHFSEEMLFNLKKDPREQDNLLEIHPGKAEEGREIYRKWHAEMVASMPYGYTEDPMQTVLKEAPFHCNGELGSYFQRLERTGRGQWVERIIGRHPELGAT